MVTHVEAIATAFEWLTVTKTPRWQLPENLVLSSFEDAVTSLLHLIGTSLISLGHTQLRHMGTLFYNSRIIRICS